METKKFKLQTIAAKLGPILHLGEASVAQPTTVSQPQTNLNEPPSQSSKKYQELNSDQNDLYRETTMASVSNVAMAGYESRLNSAASIRSEISNPLEKNFEADF